jgi:hypothetical protein
MRSRNIKLNGMMFAGLIIVISFVYAINVQPVAVGKPDVNTNYNDYIESYQTVYNLENKDGFIENAENTKLESKIFASKSIKIKPSNLVESTSLPQIAHLKSNNFRFKYLVNNNILENLLFKIFVLSGLYY